MLTKQNIESELSYAYLHAVAAAGGFSCTYSDRHHDGAGVDAVIREDGRFLAHDSQLSSFELHVQLKATFQQPTQSETKYSYSLEVPQYNKLRSVRISAPRILVVLFLPQNDAEWLVHSESGLIAQRCAYWVSLRSAPDTPNSSHQTVYIPRSQFVSTESLTALMTRFSRREEINYAH